MPPWLSIGVPFSTSGHINLHRRLWLTASPEVPESPFVQASPAWSERATDDLGTSAFTRNAAWERRGDKEKKKREASRVLVVFSLYLRSVEKNYWNKSKNIEKKEDVFPILVVFWGKRD